MTTRNHAKTQRPVRDVDAAASLSAILDCVAQPVWVVDPEGLIVFGNQAALATLGYDDLDELVGRNSHDTMHYKQPRRLALPGRGVPAGQLDPQRRRRSTPARSGSCAATARCSPSATSRRRSRRRTGRERSSRSATSRSGAAPRRRCASARRSSRRSPSPSGSSTAAAASTTPTRRRCEALGYSDLSELKGKPGHATVHYKYPDGTAVPRGGVPDHARAADRRAARRTARTGWCARTARSCGSRSRRAPFDLPDGPGSVTAFTDVEEQLARRAGGARARRRARPGDRAAAARGGASSRPPTPPARGSSATCTTAPSSSSSTSRCGCGSRAASCRPSPRRPRGCSTTRSS